MTKKKRKDFLGILCAVVILLAHLGMAVFILSSYRYYRISVTAILCILAIVVCLFLIADILLLIGYKYRDVKLKLNSLVLALLLLAGCAGGTFFVSSLNRSFGQLIDNQGEEQYETIAVVLSSYDASLQDIGSCMGKKVGILFAEGASSGSVSKDHFQQQGIDVDFKTYDSMDDLLIAMKQGEVDIAAFPASYSQHYLNDEEVDWSAYLSGLNDFYSFEQKVLTGQNESIHKDVTVDPFNMLLIGFAPETDNYGLADTIMVASVNPQSFQVSLTSIPRDSYVEIANGSGYKNKINAARGTSRQCLIDTVENLLDIQIDFYMEVNFKGVVQIVDAVGGIWIDSPVEFIGQDSSTERGHSYVYVPQGWFLADGEHALTYARERHAMPNGDFDRQQHQKDVILSVVKKVIESKDVNMALNVLSAAGDNISTNMSISQMTGIFNHLISAKDNVGFGTFGLLNIDSLRLTGYSSWYYNYSAHLPLWIYKLYDGSIQETYQSINTILGRAENREQPSYFNFYYPYTQYFGRDTYSLYFDEEEIHEEMPAFIPKLSGYSYQEVIRWAATNGVDVVYSYIDNESSAYIPSQDGMVVDYSPGYGSLLSELSGPVYVTVMGYQLSEDDQVPNFIGSSISQATGWCYDNGITPIGEMIENDDLSLAGQVVSQSVAAGSDKRYLDSISFTYYAYPVIPQSQIDLLTEGMSNSDLEAWIDRNLIYYPSIYTQDREDLPEGALISTDVIAGDRMDCICSFTICHHSEEE